MRYALAIATIVMLAVGHAGWKNLAIFAAAALLVRPLLLPRVFDAMFVLAMAILGIGEALRLYDRIAHFDVAVHFLVPALGAPVVYVALARLEVVPDPVDETSARHYAGMFLATLAFGLALGGLWELFEWTSDSTLGSELQISLANTMHDLLADTTGSLVGATLLVLWAVRGWASVRRIPGENRMEDTKA